MQISELPEHLKNKFRQLEKDNKRLEREVEYLNREVESLKKKNEEEHPLLQKNELKKFFLELDKVSNTHETFFHSFFWRLFSVSITCLAENKGRKSNVWKEHIDIALWATKLWFRCGEVRIYFSYYFVNCYFQYGYNCIRGKGFSNTGANEGGKLLYNIDNFNLICLPAIE